jgi:hypothetical protein
MRTIATLAALLAITATAFGQDPNRNRMNEPYPEMRQQENLSRAPVAAPPANANRMNVEYSEAPATQLAGGPNPSENRLNVEWAKAESDAQAEKSGKLKKR